MKARDGNKEGSIAVVSLKEDILPFFFSPFKIININKRPDGLMLNEVGVTSRVMVAGG